MERRGVSVRVMPRANADEIVGVRDGRLLVRVTAPPADGRANEALRAVIAKRLRRPPSAVAVSRGARSRDKVVEVQGMSAEDLMRALARPPS